MFSSRKPQVMGSESSVFSRYSNMAGQLKTVKWTTHQHDRIVPSGETLLTMTAHDDKIDLMVVYIKQGASVNQPNINGNAPLHVAIRCRNEPAADILIRHSADVNIRDRSGLTPLHLACVIENRDIARKLLRAGSCPDGILDGKYYVSTPLMTAVENKDAAMARLLLDSGARVNERDWWQNSALLKAVQAGCIELVRLLLRHGADPHVVNRFGGSALHYSTIADYCDITKALVEAGCKADSVQDGAVCIDSAIRYSPLAASIHRGCFRCFTLFLHSDVDINREDVKGKTPLAYAITNRAWSCNNYHHRYVPQCYHDTKPTSIDSMRINFAKELIGRGADLYPVWDFVIWQIRHSFVQDQDEATFVMCIRAMGFVHKERFKVETFFRTLALRQQVEAMILLYRAGYMPSEEDQNIAQRLTPDSNQNLESLNEFTSWIADVRMSIRTLKNLCAIQIRQLMQNNVTYSVKKLDIPQHLQNSICLLN